MMIGLVAGLILPAMAEDNDKPVDWNSVPATVQSAITANANGGKIGKIEMETEDGITSYEAKVKTTDGKKMEVEVGTDGSLIGTETVVKWDAVPAAVQSTITANAKGGKVGKIELAVEKGKTSYEATVKADDKKSEITVAADGTLVKVEAEDDDDDGK